MKSIKNIAFCGGGIYGYAEIGALKELENYEKYLDVKNISGVSIGSIIAALYAIDYTADELYNIIFNMEIERLIKESNMLYYRLWSNYGLYDAKKLEDEIERLIKVKTNIKLCTFNQIEKNLTIIATNLNYQCPRFFNKENTPEMPISKAVRLSIGYPIIITPILFEGDLYGDGGEFINYPITIFNNLDESIGITFASYNENPNGTLKNRISIENLYEYIYSVALTISRANYISQITEEHLKRSIVIQITENINSMNLNLSLDQKKFLYESGIRAVQEQISKIIQI